MLFFPTGYLPLVMTIRKAYKRVVILEGYQNSRGLYKMNTKNTILGGIAGVVLGSSAPALAQDVNPYAALQSVPGSYEIVWVAPGTRLWNVASEYTRGDDNLENGVLKTSMCDDAATRHGVVVATNKIADLTAQLAHEAGYSALETAMRLDSVAVTIENGVCGNTQTVMQKDGIRGDGFSGITVTYNGKVPVAIPAEFLPPVGVYAPEAPAPEASAPAPPAPAAPARAPVRRPSTDGNVVGGYQHLNEFGEAPLAGHGLWLEGNFRVPLRNPKNTFGLDVDHVWAFDLAYTDNTDNTVRVIDVDMTPVYTRALGDNTRLTLGVNVDARSAAVSYAGIDAVTGQWAVGPEVGLEGRAGRTSYDGRVSLGWGNVSTVVDMDGYNATQDGLTKVKANGGLGYALFPAFSLGVGAGLENDSQDATTQDGGLVPQDETRYTLGPVVTLGKEKGPQVVLGLDDVLLHTQGGDDKVADTNSLRPYAGLQYSW